MCSYPKAEACPMLSLTGQSSQTHSSKPTTYKKNIKVSNQSPDPVIPKEVVCSWLCLCCFCLSLQGVIGRCTSSGVEPNQEGFLRTRNREASDCYLCHLTGVCSSPIIHDPTVTRVSVPAFYRFDSSGDHVSDSMPFFMFCSDELLGTPSCRSGRESPFLYCLQPHD
ncbi:hypothetical protein XENOCAPTIV_026748 [Xenoophorus captivus]|uniref:Uncharacterized protein n=1 Tax=Xenoophorus captivus TaxID=1517983 RepID=A0ABV0SBF7_9TELE